MYITKVISYNGAWEKLLSEHEATFHEIQQLFKRFDLRFYDPHDRLNSGKFLPKVLNANVKFLELFLNEKWEPLRLDEKYYLNRNKHLGLMKGNIVLEMSSTKGCLKNFIFKIQNYSSNYLEENIEIVILINMTKSILKLAPPDKTRYDSLIDTYEDTAFEFQEIQPLFMKIPFLIFGIDFEPHEIEVTEITGKPEILMIERSIEFPPEYHQAGLGILNYFGTVLREKYPNQNAKVKIEQDGLTVRLIIESENGSKEVIEQALHEYELVVSGQTSPNDFFLSPIKALELKNQLGIFQLQVESQRDIIALQHGQIRDLKEIAHAALNKHTPDIKIVNQLSNTQNNSINLKTEVNQTYEQLDRLIDITEDIGLKQRMLDLQTALDAIKDKKDAAELEDSSAMKKLTKLLKEADEAGSSAKGLIEKGGEALSLFKKLGEQYNVLAKLGGFSTLMLSYLN